MSKSVNRRNFIIRCGASVALVGSSNALVSPVFAAEMVDPAGPQATALGYVTDATQTDVAKFKRYEAGQQCSNCQLYQGTPDDASAPCPLFAGKSVAGPGWCNAWVKKAG